jgi:hypothetical protein
MFHNCPGSWYWSLCLRLPSSYSRVRSRRWWGCHAAEFFIVIWRFWVFKTLHWRTHDFRGEGPFLLRWWWESTSELKRCLVKERSDAAWLAASLNFGFEDLYVFVEDGLPLRLLIRGKWGFFKLFLKQGVSHAEVILTGAATAGHKRSKNEETVHECRTNRHVIIKFWIKKCW